MFNLKVMNKITYGMSELLSSTFKGTIVFPSICAPTNNFSSTIKAMQNACDEVYTCHLIDQCMSFFKGGKNITNKTKSYNGFCFIKNYEPLITNGKSRDSLLGLKVCETNN